MNCAEFANNHAFNNSFTAWNLKKPVKRMKKVEKASEEIN